MNLLVSAKTVGQRKSHFTDWSVTLPPDASRGGGITTLRDLISTIVTAEVQAYNERQEQRRLPQVMSKAAISAGAARGKVDSGGMEQEVQYANPDHAIGTALLAFEDGFYYVFIDEVQYHSLDSEVFVKTDSRVLFLRLVPLAGG
jgi:hypothetical protein